MRAGAAWENRGGPCAAKARPSFFASWRSMGEPGRAVRSQGPTFLFCELAQHGRNGEGRAQPRPDLPFLRAGAAWENRGGPCAAKARPSFFASWRSMGEMGRAVRSQARPSSLRAGAAWEKWGGPCAARPDLPLSKSLLSLLTKLLREKIKSGAKLEFLGVPFTLP